MLRRIILGFGAGTFGQAVNIVIQLFSLPLFLLHWDTAVYGSWLMLSAVPSYLTMADIGMVPVAGNKMMMAMGRSDVAEANRVFQSAQLFMMIVCGSLGVLVTPLALWGPLPDFISSDQRIALAVLFCDVLVFMFGSLSDGVFKATGRFGLGLMLSDVIRLLEWAGSILGLLLFGNFAAVAIGGSLVRFVGTGLGMFVAQRGDYGLDWGTRHASKAEIKKMIRPAVSFMAFPLSNALSFQGVTLLVGALLGPVSVATFNTFRTVSRIAVQVTGIFSVSLWPEFGRLFGQGGPGAVEALYRHAALLGVVQAVGLSALLYFISPWLLEVWTHGRIEFEPGLMAWMLAYATVGGVWHLPRVLLQSTNQHVGLSGWSLVAAALTIVLAWGFGVLWRLEGVAAAMLVSEAFIAFICVNLVHRSFFGVSKMKRYQM
jgi:O-antigen/teichoic acid export membrane protein